MAPDNETATEPKKPEYDGSTPLENPRHETWANLVCSGMERNKAYRASGYTPKDVKAADNGAHKMSLRPDVIKRMEYLKPKVDETLQAWLAQHITSDIVDRGQRIRGYAVRRQSLLRVMAERSVDVRHHGVPGIRSGALVVTERFNAKGKLIYRETKTDTGLLRALLDIEKQAAIELRQWIEQRTDLPFDPMSLTEEDLNKMLDNFARTQPDTFEAARKALGLPESDFIEGAAVQLQVELEPVKSVNGIPKPVMVDPFD